MRHIVKAVLALLCIAIIGGSAAQAEEYRLGPGDVVSISVWGLEDAEAPKLSNTADGYLVTPDGNISLPLAGELRAAGLTTHQLTESVTQALQEYINNPKVTVNLVKLRTTRIYVLGEVNHPGMYELEKTHNVLDAIGAANGYTMYAAKKTVFIVRNGRSEKPIKIDLVKLLTKGDMSQNYTLAEGDVVYLTSNNKIDFSKDILPFLSGAYYISHFGDD